MNKVYLGLGGNIGNREAQLIKATILIQERIGKMVNQSAIYETAAWGIENQPDFLNQVIIVETDLSPMETLRTILAIEKELGRVRVQKWYTRTIDIDILFYENWIIEEKELTIPHPFIPKRNFVLAPLAEIAGDFVHPVLQKNIAEIYENSADKLGIYSFSDGNSL